MESAPQPLLGMASSGGHLTQLLAATEDVNGFQVVIATDDGFVDRQEASANGWLIFPKVGRSLPRFLVNAGRQLALLARVRPKVVFTTGSGWCLPATVLCRLFGGKAVFLESFSRVHSPSGFGKLAYLFSSTSLVQWDELHALMPRSLLIVPVFLPRGALSSATRKGTFVTVGTHDRGMDRLVESVDGAAAHGLLPTPVFVQIGAGSYEPRHCGWARSLSRHEFASHLDGAELVISHAGAGVIGQCIQRRKVPLVVPRLKEAGEVVDDHQAATADRLAREGLIVLCGDISRLASFAEAAKRAQESNPWASAEGTKRPTASEVLMRALEA